MAGNWARLEEDLRWILNPINNAKARVKMREALRGNNEHLMGAVKDAFHESTVQPEQWANFDACAIENQGRVYALGRKILAELGEL